MPALGARAWPPFSRALGRVRREVLWLAAEHGVALRGSFRESRFAEVAALTCGPGPVGQPQARKAPSMCGGVVCANSISCRLTLDPFRSPAQTAKLEVSWWTQQSSQPAETQPRN